MKGTSFFGTIVAIGAGQVVGDSSLPRKIRNGRTTDNETGKIAIGFEIARSGSRHIGYFISIMILKEVLPVGKSDLTKLAGIGQSGKQRGGGVDLIEHEPHRPGGIKVFYIIGTGSQEEAKKKVCYVFKRQSHWSIVYCVPTRKGEPKNGMDVLRNGKGNPTTGKGGSKNGKSVLNNLAQRDVCHRTRSVGGRQETDCPTESSGITNQNI